MAHFLQLQSVDAVHALLEQWTPLGAESVGLPEALGRILAQDFSAPENLPGFVRSTMDGFAVRAKDMFGASEAMPALLNCIGECAMGEVPTCRIEPGQTARIWTGGMLPEGADAVVMLEYSREAGGHQIELTHPVAPFDHVIAADEDAAKGDLLLPAGRLLRPQELGLFAALGVTGLAVYKKPQVAVISSGEEVVPAHAAPKPGQIRDINASTLSALVHMCGGESRRMGIAGDSPEALLAMIGKALDWADVILVSGGSSAGQRDYTASAFTELGATLLVHGVAISPGKPLIMARKGAQSFWGLPGHAASTLVCAEVFIRPLLYKLSGRLADAPWRLPRKAVLARSVASAQGRRDYIRVRLSAGAEGALPVATPVSGKSGLITTLVEADALVICPENLEGLNVGARVDLHELL